LNAIIEPSGPHTYFDESYLVHGNLLGGAASWVGGIPELGIADGSTLLLGNVIDGVKVTNGPSHYFSFLIDVVYSDPELDFTPLMRMDFFRTINLIPGLDPPLNYEEDDPFNYSFTTSEYTFDYLFNYTPISVTESSSLLLFGIGLAGLGFVRQRKRS